MDQETKKRIYLWIYPSTELQVKQLVERHGYKSPSEFIEAAVLNYIGQLTTAENMDYVAQTLSTFMEAGLTDYLTFPIEFGNIWAQGDT